VTGIVLPQDRTQRQPARCYCYNPECKPVDADRYEFETEHDYFECPKCGANEPPMVGTLVLIHLLKRNRMGPIKGDGGLRYSIACDEKRAYLATRTNLEAVTTVPSVSNCPGCLKAAHDQKLLQTGFILT
jgi:hypothetical protein